MHVLSLIVMMLVTKLGWELSGIYKNSQWKSYDIYIIIFIFYIILCYRWLTDRIWEFRLMHCGILMYMHYLYSLIYWSNSNKVVLWGIRKERSNKNTDLNSKPKFLITIYSSTKVWVDYMASSIVQRYQQTRKHSTWGQVGEQQGAREVGWQS